MSTNAFGALERAPTTNAPYTYHTEPAAQGGARYVRCTGCGRESVPADPDRILHRDGCPKA